ncbi:hypothetical protein DS745_02540 [Anaerobacillus alkaliphilus]|uniref:Uncharacterized protein n=1 Tax=Anaerobacillus alkaliphilus TaxID=1548597 RepID=A0A4Q0W0K9_9BACI|nr:hypothetical protein [Anaerobacillus alkaliphilus]RXJ04281.1 hypothetical protein DS745_02540 [Anaerobacillus alkaliphilus]
MDTIAIIVVINIGVLGFVIWTISNMNDKLDLLLRIQLKKHDVRFLDEDMEAEVEKYRDKGFIK